MPLLPDQAVELKSATSLSPPPSPPPKLNATKIIEAAKLLTAAAAAAATVPKGAEKVPTEIEEAALAVADAVDVSNKLTEESDENALSAALIGLTTAAKQLDTATGKSEQNIKVAVVEAVKALAAASPAAADVLAKDAAKPAAAKPAEITKENAIAILTRLQSLLSNGGTPKFNEISKILADNGIPKYDGEAMGGGGGGKMHRKKKTGISRRIRRSRVGANTRRSREFH
jgi:hypothetical protein